MAGSAEEPAKLFNGNVFQPCALAGRSIRRSCAKEALAFQVFDQAGIYGRRQIGNTDKAPPDKLAARGTDKFQHFRMSSFVVGAFDEDEAKLALLGGALEFALGGGDSVRIFVTILVAKESDIDGAAIHFIEVNVIGALVGSGQVLESKRVEIAAQQRVASDEVGQGATLSSEFLLDGAD